MSFMVKKKNAADYMKTKPEKHLKEFKHLCYHYLPLPPPSSINTYKGQSGDFLFKNCLPEWADSGKVPSVL